MTRTRFLLLAIALLTAGCGHAPPDQVEDACLILEDNGSWWRALRRSERRWGIPPAIQLAILKRESSFNANARPARRRLLGFIPGSRPSSAYGYAQALDGTWDEFQDDTGQPFADRDSFENAVDFVGWYGHLSGERSGIAPTDARALYLAYHEGHGGYNRGSYRSKGWLMQVADTVAADAARYQSQLNRCERRLNRRRFWLL
tara:strand:+ start:439 stop:1044 length:606 start_codon:yes stop_codon:yes gene_type:complete